MAGSREVQRALLAGSREESLQAAADARVLTSVLISPFNSMNALKCDHSHGAFSAAVLQHFSNKVHESSTLVRQFLLLGQFIETSTTKSLPFMLAQKDYISPVSSE